MKKFVLMFPMMLVLACGSNDSARSDAAKSMVHSAFSAASMKVAERFVGELPCTPKEFEASYVPNPGEPVSGVKFYYGAAYRKERVCEGTLIADRTKPVDQWKWSCSVVACEEDCGFWVSHEIEYAYSEKDDFKVEWYVDGKQVDPPKERATCEPSLPDPLCNVAIKFVP